ncbi:nucleophile aminohydrolase [Amylostereum chailletii]|nr:nucleophile aminohydrolase [Amylostereum chailletii]
MLANARLPAPGPFQSASKPFVPAPYTPPRTRASTSSSSTAISSISSPQAVEPPPFYLIAAHAGAGFHPPGEDAPVRAALRTALQVPAPLLPDADALSTITSVVSTLENAPALNAGYGSNLTLLGHVECDAAIMEGSDGHFGAVGAVDSVKNPIKLARTVLEGRRRPDALGRVPPLMIVGGGADKLAIENGVGRVAEDALVSERARKEWEMWRGRYDSLKELEKNGAVEATGPEVGQMRDALRARQDTVGAVVFDCAESFAAGVSSGGLLLKPPGRVGEAAIYGAGCWADNRMACSISGRGELIMQSALAKTIADELEEEPDGDMHEILRSVLVDKFYLKWKARGEPQPDAGILLLRKQVEPSKARLWCAFTTPTMAIAHASSVHPKPKTTILRNPSHSYTDDEHPPIYITSLPLI